MRDEEFPNSLIDHWDFESILPYIEAQPYKRERLTRGANEGEYRVRLWLKGAPHRILQTALSIQIRCPACNRLMHPIRTGKSGYPWIAASCPQKVDLACSRSPEAKLEVSRIRAIVEGLDPPPREPLQEGLGI